MQQNAQHQGQIMQNSQQLSKQQQQQLSVQLPGSRRTSFRDGGGMGTPKSSANRPPSAQPRPPSVMRQSASPMRPPSAQPASRQSFNMSAAGGGPQLQVLPQALSPNSPTFKFYNPLKSSKRGSRDSSSSNSLTVQGVAHASSSNSIMQLSLPQMSATMNNANNEVFATSAPQQIPTINPAILNQYLPMATPNNVTTTPSDVERRPSQIQKSSSTSTPTSSSGKKTSMPRQQPHESTLSYDEVRKLANQLSCEEKIVWVSKQVLGTHGSNGFQKAMSNVQKTKRQRTRQYKKQHQDDADTDYADQERLKAETFNARVAEKMITEMNQGLQFCDLMADTLKSILVEIDPDNPLISVDSAPAAPSLLEIQKNPRVAETMAAMHAISSAVSASLQETNKGGGGGRGAAALQSRDVSTSIMHRGTSTNTGGHVAQTAAQINPQGSTLRKSRKRSSTRSHGDRDLVALIGDHDNGKKLTKKELSSRLFEATRFRTLNEGDFVAAKVSNQDLWILARVLQQWNAVDVPLRQILDMSDIKREALFRERVFIQENEEYNGDLSSARAVKRQHILPLARSHVEGNEWGKRLRQGSRVYAIYPRTMTLYSATVIDWSTYCRNQDDVIVVEFDDDEVDDSGVVPQRHILARFVTLVPREFETNRRKRKSTSDAAIRRRSSKFVTAMPTAPPVLHQADNMIADMMYHPSAYDDIIATGLTPGSSPGPSR